MTNILHINASGRKNGSVTRALSSDLVGALQQQADSTVMQRDLSDGIDVVDEEWIAANFTPAESRSTAQQKKLAYSDALVEELQNADVLVIGSPIYNFGIPSTLKAWVDMIARARLTFRYTEQGPEGLLKGKKAYLVIASGGVEVDSTVDFATPYLRQALRFVGITDIEVVGAKQAGRNVEDVLDQARADIATLIHTGANDRAA